MEGVFSEFENENGLRSYPFASGCVPAKDTESLIPVDVFVDAVLYPINSDGVLYLSRISEDGVFEVSDDTGVVMSGKPSGSKVDLYDASGMSRHVGMLVASSASALQEFAGRGVERTYDSSETAFASSCVFPIVVDGVSSVSVSGSDKVVGVAGFSNANNDVVRVSSGKNADTGQDTIRFDVVPRPGARIQSSIRRIICIVDGQTPFRIEKSSLAYNTVIVRLEGIDRDAVCAAAHRENSYEMVDTCECARPEQSGPKDLPDTNQWEEVFIPDGEEGMSEPGKGSSLAYNAFYLAVPNFIAYNNPLSITLEDGAVNPKLDNPKVDIDGRSASLANGEMLDSTTSKGVVIQVPGLSGGQI